MLHALTPYVYPAAANNTGLESDLAKKITDTMAQASKFNLDAAAIAFNNGARSKLYIHVQEHFCL